MKLDHTKFEYTERTKQTVNITEKEVDAMKILKRNYINFSAFVRHCILQLVVGLKAGENEK